MTIAGAHSVLFTTGRGNPMGFPVPTVKISTNTDLAKSQAAVDRLRRRHPGQTRARVIDDAADQACSTRSSTSPAATTLARNEKHGWREIAIWKNGVTL